MLTKRCRLPSSVISRPRMPGYCSSRLVSSSASVSPEPSTAFAPPVYWRRMVGTRTSIAMIGNPSKVKRWTEGTRSTTGATLVVHARRALPEQVLLHGVGIHAGVDDADRLLGDAAVHDAVRPDRGAPGVRGGHQEVVRARLTREVDVGPRRVRLGGRVGVVDHHRLLVTVVHLPPDPQLLH